MSHDWILKTREEWMDVPPMIFTGNPLNYKTWDGILYAYDLDGQ